MPAVAFTDPELASVGMTVAEAKKRESKQKATNSHLLVTSAISLDKTEGFMRLVTTVEDNVIIGAQIAGVGASDMISELALAIESGMNAEDIALTIHPHPSLGEITMDTAELALGFFIFNSITLSHDRYNAPFALVALATARAGKQRLLGVVVFMLCSFFYGI